MSKVLNTDKLVVGYGNTVVVEGVNIAIEPGSITTIIGPNGSGKSTILKTILGQIKPLEGAVFIEGLNSLSLDRNAKAKKISMVITNRPRTELMTCFDVVATARYPYTGRFGLLADKDINAINDALDFVGAKDLSDNDFSCLSDGQKQRIMIARAIAQNPKILILDEPTSFLDIKYKLDILGCIKKLVTTNNVAVIMSLHELELARSISDTVITVENNKIGRVGKVEEIFSDGYIPRLYNIDPKNFDEKNGVIIMPEWS